MKHLLVTLCVLLATVTVVNCGGKSGEMMGMQEMPKPEGAAFWTYISATSPYTSWQHWPGYEGIYPGKSPHGAYLKLYANDIAIKAAKMGQALPSGAILVKENYAKDQQTLMAVTPMFRVKGYNPEGGDWFWAKYGPSGEVMAEGKPKGCISCHGAVKNQDWLFSLPK